MKNLLKCIFSIAIYSVLLVGIFALSKPISNYIVENVVYKKEVFPLEYNNYSKKSNFNYLQINSDFDTKNKTDLINNIYTIVDSGISEYSFYCSDEYINCLEDIKDVATDNELMTIINNFTNPYNSFNKLYVTTNTIGKITIKVEKLYTSDDINYLNDYMNNFLINNLNDSMSNREKIKTFHDYIINNTSYDKEKANEIKNNIHTENTLESHKATGVLKNHIALCSGYTDAMAIFLNKINVPNYKISTDSHIWNVVNLDNTWYHLDMTWDDPVLDTGREILIDEFMLITNNELKEKNTGQHDYDATVYSEIATN